MVGKSQNVFFH